MPYSLRIVCEFSYAPQGCDLRIFLPPVRLGFHVWMMFCGSRLFFERFPSVYSFRFPLPLKPNLDAPAGFLPSGQKACTSTQSGLGNFHLHSTYNPTFKRENL